MTWLILAALGGFLIGIGGTLALCTRVLRNSVADVERLETEVKNALWQLGGRIRHPRQPAVYKGPPGTRNLHTCDEARETWMDTACDAAQRLRAHGLPADDIYPDVQAASQSIVETQP